MKIKKEKDKQKEDLKKSIKFLKEFKTLNFKQQNEVIRRLEKRLNNDICTRT